ncbi:MAG: hypothetical protein KDC92_08695, partial [Bacteroidetes bacterium]|nr:hypothetical protein [Bacteroidota bacterium]
MKSFIYFNCSLFFMGLFLLFANQTLAQLAQIELSKGGIVTIKSDKTITYTDHGLYHEYDWMMHRDHFFLLKDVEHRPLLAGAFEPAKFDSITQLYRFDQKTFIKGLRRNDYHKSIAFSISKSEVAFVFIRRSLLPIAYNNQQNGLYFDILDLNTNTFRYNRNGKKIISGSFDKLGNNPLDVVQKPGENYAYWLVSHNHDSICLFSFDADTCYLSDFRLKPEREPEIDILDDGFGGQHGSQTFLKLSKNGQSLAYRNLQHRWSQSPLNPDSVKSNLRLYVKLYRVNTHIGKFSGTEQKIIEYKYDENVHLKWNSNLRRYTRNSPYHDLQGGIQFYSHGSNLIFIPLKEIEVYAGPAGPYITKLLAFLRYNIKANQIDTIHIPDSLFTYGQDFNIISKNDSVIHSFAHKRSYGERSFVSMFQPTAQDLSFVTF